jgi:hypothetical protein
MLRGRRRRATQHSLPGRCWPSRGLDLRRLDQISFILTHPKCWTVSPSTGLPFYRPIRLRGAGRSRDTTLADRARLPEPRAGGRPGPLRRAWMARVTPLRDVLHRSLWIPGRRTGDFFSLKIAQPPKSKTIIVPADPESKMPPLRPEQHIPTSCDIGSATDYRAGPVSATVPVLRHWPGDRKRRALCAQLRVGARRIKLTSLADDGG